MTTPIATTTSTAALYVQSRTRCVERRPRGGAGNPIWAMHMPILGECEYYGADCERLPQVKARHDPENVFSFEQSVPLSSESTV
ncbi:BBE domain-containing protein [Nocardia vinacea]